MIKHSNLDRHKDSDFYVYGREIEKKLDSLGKKMMRLVFDVLAWIPNRTILGMPEEVPGEPYQR